MSELPELDRITDKVLAYRPAKPGQDEEEPMAEIREIEIDGNVYRAIELTYDIYREDWAEYKFSDGGRARVKTTVVRMFQVLDGDNKPMRRPNGDRAIIVEHETTAVFSD